MGQEFADFIGYSIYDFYWGKVTHKEEGRIRSLPETDE